MTEPRPNFPSVIKHYQLVRTIGQGGMGLVCEGVDRRDGTRVAVKLLFPSLAASDPSFIDRFEREAHVGALLRSPYTVHLIDYGVEDNMTYLVMEFIDGETLAALIRRDPPDAVRALRIAGEIARALEEASARGVVHRDIKPENILLDKGGRVKVTDFGIARAVQGGSNLTQAGLFLGTPTYAAPEQIDGQVDHRSDIYSLGVTLYAMLAGRPPFIGKTPIDTMLSHKTMALPMAPLSHLPDLVTNIVRRCMEKDPLDRYQSASELAGAIDRARSALGRDAAAPGVLSAGGAGSSGSHSSYQPPSQPSAPSQPVPLPQVALQPTPQPVASSPPPAVAASAPAMRGSGAPSGEFGPSETHVLAPSVVRPQAQVAVPVASVLERAAPPPTTGSKSRLLMIAGGAVLAAAVVAGGAFVAISGGGDDKPGAGAATETPAATGTRPTTPAPTAVSPTSVPATPTSGATVAATNLPSVTAPAAVSRLRSGVTARALLPVNMLQDPSGSSTVVRLLAPGARVVVVTNTPAASTVVTTEGLIFWRVVVEGTTVVGWIPEVTVDGATRFLDTVQ